MCQCYLVKPYAEIDYQELRWGWRLNDDGAGYMFADKGKLVIRKPFWHLDSFISCLHADREKHENRAFVIHMRLATSGNKVFDNCHPISVNDNLAFVHNGIFKEFSYHAQKSDTVIFNEVVLQSLPSDFLYNDATLYLLKEYCFCSKLIFLDVEGKWSIINEVLGTWKNNIWYSYNPVAVVPIMRTFNDDNGTTRYNINTGESTYTGESARKLINETPLVCDVCDYPVAYKDTITTNKYVICEGCYNRVLCSRLPCPSCKDEILLLKENNCRRCGKIISDNEIIEFAMKGYINA
jgi:hypothetical protein